MASCFNICTTFVKLRPKQLREETIFGTYDVKHYVVAQAWRAVDADQDAVLDGGAKANCQPVCPCAWPLVIGPRVRDQSASFAKDVRGARCEKTKRKQFNTSSALLKNSHQWMWLSKICLLVIMPKDGTTWLWEEEQEKQQQKIGRDFHKCGQNSKWRSFCPMSYLLNMPYYK